MEKDSKDLSVASIMLEFEKSNDQLNDLIRLQNELSQSENELLTLQIRFVHKNRENDSLKTQLDSTQKSLNDAKLQVECKQERLQSVEFHYNELMQKHKMCLECMSMHRDDHEALKAKLFQLETDNHQLEIEKTQLQEIFKDQIEDLDTNLKKLVYENENNVATIRDLRKLCQSTRGELDKANTASSELAESNRILETQLEQLRMQLDQSLNTHEVKKECTDERIANLEVELAKVRSKRDECQLQMLEFKNNYASQAKAADSFERKLRQSEYECSQMRLNYESCMTELRVLSEANAQYETCVRELEFKVNDEHVVTARGRQNMEDVIQRLVKSYQEQQKKIEAVVGAYKVQSMHVQTLRDLVEKFREQFSYTKPKLYEHQFQFNQNQNHIRELQEKCMDLESKYLQKCEHLNSLEREIYLTRNSLDSSMNELANLSAVLKNKNDELANKNHNIDRLESIITQLNVELNKRKSEINERITQIEILDNHVKEEKNSMDVKMTQLETSLKSKTKQLHQRIDQIKELSDLVNKLKEEKEQAEYKNEQCENVIKCQKMEIDSKASLVKQLELRVMDAFNEMADLRNDDNKDAKDRKTFNNLEIQTESKADWSIVLSRSINTDTNSLNTTLEESGQLNVTANYVDKTVVEDLRLNLKVKESLIESINDSLILKEAEIARLKARLAVLERRSMIHDE